MQSLMSNLCSTCSSTRLMLSDYTSPCIAECNKPQADAHEESDGTACCLPAALAAAPGQYCQRTHLPAAQNKTAVLAAAHAEVGGRVLVHCSPCSARSMLANRLPATKNGKGLQLVRMHNLLARYTTVTTQHRCWMMDLPWLPTLINRPPIGVSALSANNIFCHVQ